MIAPTANNHRRAVEVYDLEPATVAALTRLLGPSQSRSDSEPLVVSATAHDVSWLAYESFLSGISDRLLRHTYSSGTLEIMSPREFERETTKSLLRRFVQSLTFQRRISVQSLGSTTLASPGKSLGIEPDELFHFGPACKCQARNYLNVHVHGSPSLAIEVASVGGDGQNCRLNADELDRSEVLKKLGVSEVWLVERGVVQICRNNAASPARHSAFLAKVSADMLTDHLRMRYAVGENEAIRAFLAALSID
jgi:Uma2 family endonuclease